MVIKELKDVEGQYIEDLKVTKKVVLGPEDGSNEIILRHFKVEKGGMSPRHTHNFPHLVKVEAGEGMYVDDKGNKHPLSKGKFVYVNDNELHNFENAGDEPFEFICIVPERGEL